MATGTVELQDLVFISRDCILTPTSHLQFSPQARDWHVLALLTFYIQTKRFLCLQFRPLCSLLKSRGRSPGDGYSNGKKIEVLNKGSIFLLMGEARCTDHKGPARPVLIQLIQTTPAPPLWLICYTKSHSRTLHLSSSVSMSYQHCHLFHRSICCQRQATTFRDLNVTAVVNMQKSLFDWSFDSAIVWTLVLIEKMITAE